MNLFPGLRQLLGAIGIHVDPEVFLPVFLLLTVRTTAAFSFIPFFGGEAVPGRVRVGLSLAIAAVLYPLLPGPVRDAPPPDFRLFLVLIAKEILAGALLGILVQIVSSAAEAAGYLIEFQAGLNPQAIQAPQMSSEASLMGRLLGQASIAFCLAAGLHRTVIRALVASYDTIPLMRTIRVRPGFSGLAQVVGGITADFIVLAVQLSAPILLVLLLVTLGSGLVLRMASPQIQDQPLQPLGTITAYGALFLGSGLLMEEIFRQAGTYLVRVEELFHALARFVAAG